MQLPWGSEERERESVCAANCARTLSLSEQRDREDFSLEDLGIMNI